AGDFIIESDAVIADRDRRRIGGDADVDAPFAVAIANGIDGIAHEVLDGAAEERGVGARFRFAADADANVAGDLLEARDDIAANFGELDAMRVDRHRPRESQQRVDESAERRRLFLRALHTRAHFLRRAVALRELEVAENRS